MSLVNSDLFLVTGICLETLAKRGYEVADTIIDDDLEAEMLEAGRHPPAPLMSHRSNDFTTANSRWFTLRYNGNLVGTLAVRCDDLGGRLFPDFLEALFGRHYGPETSTIIRPGARRRLQGLTGRAVYAGDLWFHRDHRGDAAKTVSFCRFVHNVAFAQWVDASFMYAFHWRRHALSGMTDQYGFISGNTRGVQFWNNPPPGRKDEEQLSLIMRDDWLDELSHLIKHPQELRDPQVPVLSQVERKRT